jgi:hypothetical protein
MIMDLIIKVMVELLSVLAFVTEKFVRKLRGEGNDKIEAALERLDRLTKDEGLPVVAQTLGEVKRLWFLRPHSFVTETDGIL